METQTITPLNGLPGLEAKLADNPAWLDEAINPEEASRLRDKTTTALAIERSRGRGPDYIKDGKTIRYTRRAIFEYLARKRVAPA